MVAERRKPTSADKVDTSQMRDEILRIASSTTELGRVVEQIHEGTATQSRSLNEMIGHTDAATESFKTTAAQAASVSEAVDELASSINETAASTEQVGVSTKKLNDSLSEIGAAMEQVAASTQSVTRKAQDMTT